MNSDGGWIKTSLEQSRADEYRADQLAVEFAKSAGYESSAYGRYHWRTMGYGYRAGQRVVRDDSSSTHPSGLNRIIAINQFIESPI